MEGHALGHAELLIHSFFPNVNSPAHTMLGTGDTVDKTEKVPKLIEYTSQEADVNQIRIEITASPSVCHKGAQWRVSAQALEADRLGENLALPQGPHPRVSYSASLCLGFLICRKSTITGPTLEDNCVWYISNVYFFKAR